LIKIIVEDSLIVSALKKFLFSLLFEAAKKNPLASGAIIPKLLYHPTAKNKTIVKNH